MSNAVISYKNDLEYSKEYDFADDDTIADSVIECVNPFTPILEGKNGIILDNVTLINCQLPEDIIVLGNCVASQISYCSYLHKDLVRLGLVRCTEWGECRHVKRKFPLSVDGFLLMQDVPEFDDRVMFQRVADGKIVNGEWKWSKGEDH